MSATLEDAAITPMVLINRKERKLHTKIQKRLLKSKSTRL